MVLLGQAGQYATVFNDLAITSIAGAHSISAQITPRRYLQAGNIAGPSKWHLLRQSLYGILSPELMYILTFSRG
jgi:hypothetical protein